MLRRFAPGRGWCRCGALVIASAVAATGCSQSTSAPEAASAGSDGAAASTAPADPFETATSDEAPPATSQAPPGDPPPTSVVASSIAPPTSVAASSTAPPTSTMPPATQTGPAPPVPPADAAETATRLAAVEAQVVEGVVDTDRLVELGHEHQTLYRALSRDPDWIAVLDPDGRRRAETIIDASESAARSVPTPLTDAPRWTIRRPLPPAELRSLYDRTEAATGTPWEVLAAINLVETRMGRIVGDSSAGAQGPMQFIPATWDVYGAGGDPFDDADAIAAAGRLLADAGAPDDLASAIYAYNPSDAYVASILRYAELFEREPWTYDAFWGWQVYVITVDGLQWMPEGTVIDDPRPFAELRDVLPAPVPTTPPDQP